jgi:hypothetical protein
MRFYAPWFGFDPDGARRYPDGTVIVWSGSPGGSSSTPKRPACPKIRLHDVRHSYATAALAAGIPAKVVSERLGHANIAITMDTYSHVLPGLDAQAAGAVARLILGDNDQAPTRPIDTPFTTGRKATSARIHWSAGCERGESNPHVLADTGT